MNRYAIVAGGFLFLIVMLIIGLILFTNQGQPSKTTVSVSEGAVEVSELNSQGMAKTLSAGEEAIAMNGGLEVNKSSTELSQEEPVAIASHMASSSTEAVAAEAVIVPTTRDVFHIAGYSQSEDGNTISGSLIKVYKIIEDKSSKQITTVESNELGYYLVELKEEGKYWLRSEPNEEYLFQSATVVLSASEASVTQNFIHTKAGLAVRGKVVDKITDEPVVGAEVTLQTHYQEVKPGQHSSSATSGADGTFTIRRLTEGNYGFETKAKGYISYRPMWNYDVPDPLGRIHVDEQTQEKEFLIKLEPGKAVTIRVTNYQKQPVQGADVRIIQSDRSNRLDDCYGKTDSLGEITLTNVPEGLSIARVQKESYGENLSETFEPGPVEQPTVVEVALHASGTVSGTVKDKDGNPVKERRLFANYREIENKLRGNASGIHLNEARTDDSGNYQFKDLGPGLYRISVQSEDRSGGGWYDLGSKEVTLQAGEQMTGVDFVIEDIGGEGEFKGKVVNKNGEPVNNANVNVHVRGGDESNYVGRSGHANTNEQGEFHVKGLIEGETAHVNVNARGYSQYSQQHSLNEEQVVITLESTSNIRGIVIAKDTREPVAGAEVYLEGSRGRYGRPIVSFSGSDGTFTLEDVEPGSYSIQAKGDEFAKTQGPDIAVVSGQDKEDVVVEIERGMQFSGQLLSTERGPIAQASVALLSNRQGGNSPSPFGQFGQSAQFTDQVRSDAGGVFTIKNVSPKGDSILIQHEQFADRVFQITPDMLGKGEQIILLAQGGTIEGHVLNLEGQPDANIPVRAASLPDGLFQGQSNTDAKGYYRIEHLPEAHYNVGISRKIGDSMSQENKRAQLNEGQTVQVNFGTGDGAVIRGTVYQNGSPVAGANIRCMQYSISGSMQQLQAISKEDGRYEIRDVPEGDYNLMFSVTGQANNPIQGDGAAFVRVTGDKKEYQVDLTTQSTEIIGVVKDEETGQPLADAEIIMMMHGESVNFNPATMILPTKSDQWGSFKLTAKVPMRYTFSVMKEGYNQADFSVNVQEVKPNVSIPPVQVEVAMRKSDTEIRVHVIYQGQPIVDANPQLQFVFIQDGYMNAQPSMNPKLENGSYVFRGIREGSVNVLVVKQQANNIQYGFSDVIQVQKDVPVTSMISLFDAALYKIFLQTNDNSRLNGSYQAEIEGMPSALSIPGLNQIQENFVMLIAPVGRKRVRLTVPGYKPLEFYPNEMATAGGGEPFKQLTVKLSK